MKFSWVNVFLVLSFIFTCTAGIMTFVNYKKYQAKTEKINKADQVLLEVYELRNMVKGAETSQRGYLLTGKIDYLRPYLDFNKNIEAEKEKALKLGTENEIFKEDIDQLIQLVSERHAELSHALEAKETGGLEAALNIINSDKGNMLMDSILLQVKHIQSKQQTVLDKLNMDYGTSMQTANYSRYFFQFFVMSMTIISIILLNRRQRQNDNLIAELRSSKEDLETKVEQRTKELYLLTQELTAQNEEIQSQTERIVDQNDLLVNMDKEKNKFIGIASHDLKSPINRIKGLIGIMKMSPNATVATQSEYLTMMDKTIDGMLHLLKDLLDINKIDQGSRTLNISKVDLNWIVTNMCHIFTDQASAKDIVIECKTPEDKIEINSDESILMQIMENLVSNAIKFTHHGKSITVAISIVEDKARLEVRDQGVGIPESEMHLLFGKFQKLSSRPTAGEESTGLGLSIVKELVEALNGHIWCESEVEKGSTFIVELRA